MSEGVKLRVSYVSGVYTPDFECRRSHTRSYPPITDAMLNPFSENISVVHGLLFNLSPIASKSATRVPAFKSQIEIWPFALAVPNKIPSGWILARSNGIRPENVNDDEDDDYAVLDTELIALGYPAASMS